MIYCLWKEFKHSQFVFFFRAVIRNSRDFMVSFINSLFEVFSHKNMLPWLYIPSLVHLDFVKNLNISSIQITGNGQFRVLTWWYKNVPLKSCYNEIKW